MKYKLDLATGKLIRQPRPGPPPGPPMPRRLRPRSASGPARLAGLADVPEGSLLSEQTLARIEAGELGMRDGFPVFLDQGGRQRLVRAEAKRRRRLASGRFAY